ncbi:uncharacterized protein C8A04DRAFT_27230 [Dichotomopilus funicola]|uniref:Uncharacterized protein n=1 Tax=Dichotomopilus funicola TaxID=1934379 RepID=A0AAN6ZNG8_9PEZI|nr:hypothetical protein C8A04DRAFT_27230 [Dichotomopilus funicola]
MASEELERQALERLRGLSFRKRHLQLAQQEDGLTAFYYTVEGIKEGEFYQTREADTVGWVLNAAHTRNAKLETINFDVLAAKAGTQTDKKFSLLPAEAAVIMAGGYIVRVDRDDPFDDRTSVVLDPLRGHRTRSAPLHGCGVRGGAEVVGKVSEIKALGTRLGID